MENVDPVDLGFVQIIVNDETSEVTRQSLHPLSYSILASILSPVNLNDLCMLTY